MDTTNMKNPAFIGFWARFGAALPDLLILGVPSLIISGILWYSTGLQSMYYLVQLAVLVVTIYMDGIMGGTPGKLILNMRIVNQKGSLIGIPSAILRYIGKVLSTLILLIGLFMIGWDSRKQGLHDKIANTFVIRSV